MANPKYNNCMNGLLYAIWRWMDSNFDNMADMFSPWMKATNAKMLLMVFRRFGCWIYFWLVLEFFTPGFSFK